MRIRLAHKIFLAFLFTIAVIAVLLTFMQFAAIRNFSDYMNRTALEELGPLKARLRAEHGRDGGWGALRDNREAWRDLLESAGVDMRPPHPVHPPPRGRDPAQGAGRPGDGQGGEPRNPGRRPPWHPPPPPREQPDPFRLGPRLALFDADGERVAGPANPVREFTLEPLEADGRVIGRLGLHRIRGLADPLARSFLERQQTSFYLLGAAALLLTGMVTLLLSRQVLRPVKALAQGTRDLISRRFATRIPVRSSDELGALARDFNTLARTLEGYEAARRQWISDIAHELRTPLAVLRGEIEALQDGVREAKPAALASLHAEAVRLGALVEDLHRLSLADSEALLTPDACVDPAGVLRETVSFFRPRIEEKGLSVELALPVSPGPWIRGSADRLKQVYANILENTLRYARAPGALRVACGWEGPRVAIRFEDSGPGVPAESLPRLFDRLYRVEPSRSRELGGSGLGLAICRQIVEAMGGEITAEPSGLGGLCVRIALPAGSRTEPGKP